MDLKSTLNICYTCLSLNRQLYPLTTFPSTIKLNFLLTNQTASVCWECKNSIIKFCKFITKALTAQKMMVDAQHNNKIVCLSTLAISKQQPLFEYTHLDDPLIHETDEIKCIKKEDFNSDIEIDTNNEDSEQIDKTNDDLKKELDNMLMGEENDENEIESENLDVKIEITDKQKNKLNPVKLCNNIESDEDNEEVTREENFKSHSNIDNKLLNAPKEVMQYILIVELTDEEVQKQREQKRIHQNFTKWPYKCEHCIIGFKKEEKFNKHLKEYHSHMEQNNMNCCDICKVHFKSPILTQKHRESHYIQYKCRLCKFETCYEWSILAHFTNKHNSEELEHIQCDPRSLMSSRSTPIENSENLETQPSWTCGICGYKTQSRHSLRNHIRRSHPGIRKFACDNCPKTFKIKSQLEFHMISHDAGIAKQLLYCEICNMKYKTIVTYKQHMKESAKHLKERFPCSECNKQFSSEKYRKKHYKFFHLKKSDFKCDECKKMFITKFSLKQHQQIHHGLKRPRNHVCNVCGKKFFSVALLKGHSLIHSEQRSYMCSECGDTFKQPSALYIHAKLVHRIANKLFKKQKNVNK